MNETFKQNDPNPILCYNNNSVPLTEDGKIEMPYLKALIDLQPQKYGISTWLHKTRVYKYTTERNLTEGVSEVLHTGEITKQMGSHFKHKFYDMWFTNFDDHSLSFTHWYDIYQHERSQELEFAQNIHQYQQEE